MRVIRVTETSPITGVVRARVQVGVITEPNRIRVDEEGVRIIVVLAGLPWPAVVGVHVRAPFEGTGAALTPNPLQRSRDGVLAPLRSPEGQNRRKGWVGSERGTMGTKGWREGCVGVRGHNNQVIT